MGKPLISVFIPSYNRGHFIENALQSVLLQDYENWELLIQDSNSNDNTNEICSRYEKRDKRIRFSQEKDEGFADAVNKALNKSGGTIGCILSSDDFYASPSVFTEVVELFNTYPEVFIVSGKSASVNVRSEILLMPDYKIPKGFIDPSDVFNLSQNPTFFSIIRAKAIGGLDKYVDMVADTDFWIKMATYGSVKKKSVFMTDRVWSCDTIHNHQRSTLQWKFFFDRAKMAINHFYNDNIFLSPEIKFRRANGLLIDAYEFFIKAGIDTGEVETLYKKFSKKKLPFKLRAYKYMYIFRIFNSSKNTSIMSTMDFPKKYSHGNSMKWFT